MRKTAHLLYSENYIAEKIAIRHTCIVLPKYTTQRNLESDILFFHFEPIKY